MATKTIRLSSIFLENFFVVSNEVVDSTNAIFIGKNQPKSLMSKRGALVESIAEGSATTRATRYVVLEEGCLMPVLLLLLLMTWSFVTIFLSHHTHFAIFR